MVLVGALAASGLLGTAAWSSLFHDATRTQLALEMGLTRGDWQRVIDDAEDAIARHPAEPAFPLLLGTALARRADASALPALNRAMVLAPRWPQPHIEAARVLSALGRTDQALLELRAGAERDPEMTAPFVCALVGSSDTQRAWRAIPEAGITRSQTLNLVAGCLPENDAVAARMDDEILRRHPGHVHAGLRRAARLEGAARTEALETLIGAHPEDERAWRQLARAHADLNAFAAVVEVTEQARDAIGPDGTLLALEARALAALGREAAARRAVDDLRGLGGISAERMTSTYLVEADVEEMLGNPARALRAVEQAERLDPSPQVLRRLIDLSREVGDERRGYAARAKLCRLHDEEAACRAVNAVARPGHQ